MGLFKAGAELIANTSANMQKIFMRSADYGMLSKGKRAVDSVSDKVRNNKTAQSILDSGKNIKNAAKEDLGSAVGSKNSGIDPIHRKFMNRDGTVNINKNYYNDKKFVGKNYDEQVKGIDDLSDNAKLAGLAGAGVGVAAAGTVGAGYFAGKGMQMSGMSSTDDRRPNY